MNGLGNNNDLYVVRGHLDSLCPKQVVETQGGSSYCKGTVATISWRFDGKKYSKGYNAPKKFVDGLCHKSVIDVYINAKNPGEPYKIRDKYHGKRVWRHVKWTVVAVGLILLAVALLVAIRMVCLEV